MKQMSINKWLDKNNCSIAIQWNPSQNKKEWTVDTYNNMEEAQNIYAKKSHTKKRENAYCMIPLIKKSLENIKLIYSDRKQINGFLRMGG